MRAAGRGRVREHRAGSRFLLGFGVSTGCGLGRHLAAALDEAACILAEVSLRASVRARTRRRELCSGLDAVLVQGAWNEQHCYPIATDFAFAVGVPPHWLTGNGTITISNAPTIFGAPFGYTLRHNDAAKTVTIDITQPSPANVSFISPAAWKRHLGVMDAGRAARRPSAGSAAAAWRFPRALLGLLEVYRRRHLEAASD